MRPVRGFSEGTFSIDIWNLAESESTSIAWQLRSTPGSAQISIVVRSGPMPASASARTIRARRRSRREDALGLCQVLDRDVVVHEMRCAGEPARRLAGRHAHRMNGALRRRRDGVEADQRAGRHDDLAALVARQLDQLGMRQQRARAQDHRLLAGRQHRPADGVEHRGRGAFDHQVGMRGHRLQLDQRAAYALGVQPGPRLAVVARRDARELQPRHPVGQRPGDRPSDGAESRDSDPHRHHFRLPVFRFSCDLGGPGLSSRRSFP